MVNLMNKWEYKRIDGSYIGSHILNDLGRNGWELVSVNYKQYNEEMIFKRKINV